MRFRLWLLPVESAAAAAAAAAAALLELEGRPTGLPVDVLAFLGLLSFSEAAAAAGLGGLITETLPDAVRPLLMFLMALVVPLLKVRGLCFGGCGGGNGSERFVVEAARATVDTLLLGRERFFFVAVVVVLGASVGVGIFMLGWLRGIFKLMEVEVFNPVPATNLFFASSNASGSSLIVGLPPPVTTIVFVDDTTELKLSPPPSFFPSLAFRR